MAHWFRLISHRNCLQRVNPQSGFIAGRSFSLCRKCLQHFFNKFLERNQSNSAIAMSIQGGFFLRKKPLEGFASGYTYSGFALGERFEVRCEV